MLKPLQKAVKLLGGQVATARVICEWHKEHGRVVKVAQGHIWNWLHSTKRPMPPAEHCRAIEDALNGQVTCQELRPDVFSAPNPEDRRKPKLLIEERRKHDQRVGDRRIPDLFNPIEPTKGEKTA